MSVELEYVSRKELPMDEATYSKRVELLFNIVGLNMDIDFLVGDADEVVIRFKPITMVKQYETKHNWRENES